MFQLIKILAKELLFEFRKEFWNEQCNLTNRYLNS